MPEARAKWHVFLRARTAFGFFETIEVPSELPQAAKQKHAQRKCDTIRSV
jgi:hypothetical protein